jgi:hypothetical protein
MPPGKTRLNSRSRLEADYVIERLFTNSYPDRTWGGAGYIRYQFSPRNTIAGRAEYLDDRGVVFTGITQALKETRSPSNKKWLKVFCCARNGAAIFRINRISAPTVSVS